MPGSAQWMASALALAGQALTVASPNPRVGCAIVSPDGQLIGQGHTQRAGDSHAEIVALRDAAARDHTVAGSTVYVTMEPCSHHGRTGPCCDALIRAGVRRVVASITDPNPLVSGKGFERLRTAGIAVEIGVGAHASRELNLGFFSRMIRRTPWIRMKVAASLDGRTALVNANSQWITSAAARADGHAWRARSCAILTGVGTVLQDNPQLNVRLMDTPRQPQLIVVDSELRTPLSAQLFVPDRALYIYTASDDAEKTTALEEHGACVIRLPDSDGMVDLVAMARDLARREINELHVEAGQTLNGALVRHGLVDELLMYVAPKLIGQGRDVAQFGPLESLSQSLDFEYKSIGQIGPDLRIVARAYGHDDF